MPGLANQLAPFLAPEPCGPNHDAAHCTNRASAGRVGLAALPRRTDDFSPDLERTGRASVRSNAPGCMALTKDKSCFSTLLPIEGPASRLRTICARQIGSASITSLIVAVTYFNNIARLTGGVESLKRDL
jgi:hypothetical protein